jgi:glucose-6-phosphate 1-epimerase
MQTIRQLEEQFGAVKDIRFEELAQGYPVLRLCNRHAQAGIALHGAHLIDYRPAGGDPVIFTSSASVYCAGKAIRGGIPVCWPWFGPGAGRPSHGYARNNFWWLAEVEGDEEVTRLLFTLPAPEKSPLRATLEFKIGPTLSLALSTRNHGESAQVFTEALHSYFAVSDCRQTRIFGLEGANYTDTSGESATSGTQAGPVAFSGEVDRIYHSAADIVIDDGERRVLVAQQGGRDTVVWNPGPIKGAALDDLADEQISSFICAESANTEPLRLAAGECHTLRLAISILAD